MKKAIILGVTLILGITPSYADVYVKVDAQGNAIGGAIVCDSATCGAGSVYSQLTLKEGEQYVLQGKGSTGIGNNNPNTEVKVNLETNDWTVSRTKTIELPEPIKINNEEIISYQSKTTETFNPKSEVVTPVKPSPILITNETTTATAVIDTTTVLSTTNLVADSPKEVTTFEETIAYIRVLIKQIYAIFEKLGIKGQL
jgi:hypothetical protein